MLKLLLFILLIACESSSPPPFARTRIKGRSGQEIYSALAPKHWVRIDSADDLSNTMVPICSFKIGEVLLTVHNFPSKNLEERIPPAMQIERWKKQIAAKTVHLEPFSAGGFGGYRLEGYNETKAILGLSMQLTPLLYQHLLYPATKEEALKFADMRSDYTLKAVGIPQALNAYREEIIAFFESFELIEPINHF